MSRLPLCDAILAKTGKLPMEYSLEDLGELAEMASHPKVLEYLLHFLPHEGYAASKVSVHSLELIRVETLGQGGPGYYIRPYAYLCVAGTIGGNQVCCHGASGRVFFADHISFTADEICYKDQDTKYWEYLNEYTPKNVERALVFLHGDLIEFMTALARDELQEQLDRLD